MAISTTRTTRINWENSPTGVTLQMQSREGEGKEWKNEGKLYTYNLADLPETLLDGTALRSFAAYGMQKVMSERTSDITDTQSKLDYIEQLYNEGFREGKWSLPRVNGAPKTDYTMVVVALAELKGISFVQATNAWKALDATEKKDMAKNPKVVAKIAELLQKEQQAQESEVNLLDL